MSANEALLAFTPSWQVFGQCFRAEAGPPLGFTVPELLLKLVLELLAVQQVSVSLVQLSLEVRVTFLQLVVQGKQVSVPAANSRCHVLLQSCLVTVLHKCVK